jgi:hypothetical protein
MSSWQTTLCLFAVFAMSAAMARADTKGSNKSKVPPAGHSTVERVVESGCAESPARDECCTCCVPRCPRVIPAIVQGIDCLLNRIFCCPAYADPGCTSGPCTVPSYRNHGSGCCDAPGGGPVMAPRAPDPFVDDPAGAPVTRMDRRGGMPQPLSYQTLGRGKGESSVVTNGVPRTLAVPQAAPLKSGRAAVTQSLGRNQAVRTTSTDSSGAYVPANPLRR